MRWWMGAPRMWKTRQPDNGTQMYDLNSRVRAAERATLVKMRYEDRVSDHVLRKLERELDLLDTRFMPSRLSAMSVGAGLPLYGATNGYSVSGLRQLAREQSVMVWVGEPMTWILIGVAGCVILGLICIFWATQGRPMSESPHHDEF